MSLRQRAVVDMPESRAHHAAAVLGCCLFVHGGLSSEVQNKTLGDWNVLDFGIQVWMKCEVLEAEGKKLFAHARKYHTMTAAFDPTFTSGREQTRLLLVSALSELMRKPKSIE